MFWGAAVFAQTSGMAPLSSSVETTSVSRGAAGAVPPAPDAAKPNTNTISNVWDTFPGAVEAPGAVHVSTNANGLIVHSFSMHPVATNMAVFTNDLAQIEMKQAAMEKELADLTQREVPLKRAVMADHKAMSAIVTNFVPTDAEGKKLKQRMVELVAEMKAVGAQLQKLQESDPAFLKVKIQMDADDKALKDVLDRKNDIGAQQAAINATVWQAKKLEAEKQKTSQQAPPAVPKSGEL